MQKMRWTEFAMPKRQQKFYKNGQIGDERTKKTTTPLGGGVEKAGYPLLSAFADRSER